MQRDAGNKLHTSADGACTEPCKIVQGVEGDEEKPESWEHEEERADDDVEMGEDAASEPEPPPVRS